MVKKQTKKSAQKQRAPKKAPVAISRTQMGGAPVIKTTATSVRIKHREYFCDVTVPADTGFPFHVDSVPINPGYAATFPWLHDIANRWEMYRFHKLAFEYIPSCPSNTNGRIAMAVDFDALDGLPENKVALNSFAGVQACSVWDGTKMVVPPARLGLGMPQRYTRRGQHSDLDLKTYDLGNFIWATYDVVPGAAVPGTDVPIGELWVEYEVELLVPQTRTVAPTVAFRDTAGGPLGTTTVLSASPVQTGTGILRLLAPGMADFDGSETRLKVMDSFEGVVSLMAKGNSAPPGFTGSIISPRGISTLTQMWAHGTTTVSSADWVASLKSGSILRFTKLAGAALGPVMLYMSAIDPASMRQMLEWGGL